MGLDHGPRGQIREGKQVSTTEMINHELAARWEMCCEAVGIDTDATAAEWREAYEAKRAQVRREAAEPHLRKKWAEEVRELHYPVEVEPSDTICGECSYPLPDGQYLVKVVEYPCPTIRALGGEQG